MARPDPFDSEEDVAAWAAAPEVHPLAIFRYDDVGHNFLDLGGPDWNEAAVEVCAARILAFLGGLDGCLEGGRDARTP